jgi:hypothetical protein
VILWKTFHRLLKENNAMTACRAPFDRAADAIVASIPFARRQRLEGQTHVVDAKALAPYSHGSSTTDELDDGR